MKAITPIEAAVAKAQREFPDFVIDAFNQCILAAMLDGKDEVEQEEVIMRMLSLNPELKRQEIFDNHFLDVEDYYRSAGWKVVYYKPAYYEEWKAFWEFKS